MALAYGSKLNLNLLFLKFLIAVYREYSRRRKLGQ